MTKIVLGPHKMTARGRLYRVHYRNGILLEASRNPEFDACRALLSQGVTGALEVWLIDTPYRLMTLDIEKAAKLTVAENDTDGLRFRRWRAFGRPQL